MRRLINATGRMPHFLLIAFAVTLSRFNALSNGFVQDGMILVVENPFIKGLHNLPLLLKSGYWVAIGKTGGLYRPLTMVSFLIEHSLFGLDPLAYHLVNVVLHICCAILVYLLVEKVVDDRTAALTGALVFAAHPALTEVVATVQGRAELLSALFTLAGLLVFAHAPRRALFLAASAVLFLLGLFSKETAAVLPVLALVYILVFEGDQHGRIIQSASVSMLPYAAAAALYIALRAYAIGGEPVPPPESIPLVNVGAFGVFLTMMKALTQYIRLMFFPTDLLIVYEFPPARSLFMPSVLSGLAALAAFAAASLRIIRLPKTVYFFVCWFFIALLPVSNIIPTGIIMSERAMYLPAVSFSALFGLAAAYSINRSVRKTGVLGHLPSAVVAVILVAFCALSLQRSAVWASQDTYFDQVVRDYKRYIRLYPDISKYHLNLAETYLIHGDGSNAEEELLEAVRLAPGSFWTHTQLAMYYEDHNQPQRALAEAQRAFDLSGGRDDLSMGVIASSYFKLGRHEDADKAIKRAISIKPDRAAHYINQGLMLKSWGDIAGSLESLRRAVQVQPAEPEAHFILGKALGEFEQFGPAADELEKAVSFRPYEPKYRYYLAVAYYGSGEYKRAASELEKALRLKPGYPEARALYEAIRQSPG